MTKIKGLLVEPNELPKEIEFESTLEEEQKLVGGHIECVYLPNDDEVVLICNEEGKIYGMQFNRDIGRDIIAGPFLILGIDDENEDFKSLNDNQILKYKKRFDEKSIIDTENRINAIKMKNAKAKEYER